jgi:hypothetical protein
MKVVKLNRRFRQFKEQGHVVALKFHNGYDHRIRDIEKICRAKLRSGGWLREHDWYSYYGKSRNGLARDYWITFRNEADLTLVLLSVDLPK